MRLADVEQVLDQHAERRAPVADVVLRHDVVPRERKQARERVADDRRAQMADMHLLRDVRRRVVDDDALLVGGERHAETVVACDAQQRALEERGLEREIDETGPGDFDSLRYVGEIACGDDRFGNLARRALQRFREPHRQVGLEVRALRASNHCIDVVMLGAERLHDGRS